MDVLREQLEKENEEEIGKFKEDIVKVLEVV